MNRWLAICVAVWMGIGALAGCERPSGQPQVQAATADDARKQWTAEEIAADPQGYLQWSDRQVQQQIAQRQEKSRSLVERRRSFEERRALLEENITSVRNIHRRLGEAMQRAEDEDRWPARMADRTFTREKATAILAQTKQYVEERQPLLQTYDQLLQKMDETAATLQQDVANLQRLRERLAIDLERVRLNQTLGDVDALRKTQQELAEMGRTVADMSEDPLSLAPPREPPGRVDIEAMLR
jgi:hypothetical protein